MLENDLKMLLNDTYESLINIAGENGVSHEKVFLEFQKMYNNLVDTMKEI